MEFLKRMCKGKYSFPFYSCSTNVAHFLFSYNIYPSKALWLHVCAKLKSSQETILVWTSCLPVTIAISFKRASKKLDSQKRPFFPLDASSAQCIRTVPCSSTCRTIDHLHIEMVCRIHIMTCSQNQGFWNLSNGQKEKLPPTWRRAK